MNAPHDPIPAATAAVTARTAEVTAARDALARHERAEALARETADRAATMAETATNDHADATSKAVTAEATWTEKQTAARWTDVEATRAARDQAELRARSTLASAHAADADIATARTRTVGAQADLAAAEDRLQRAQDVLTGFRAKRTAMDEATAAEVGRRQRLVADHGAQAAAHLPALTEAAGPHIARYVAGVREILAAVTALDAVLADATHRAYVLDQLAFNAGVDNPHTRLANKVTHTGALLGARAAFLAVMGDRPAHLVPEAIASVVCADAMFIPSEVAIIHAGLGR